MLHVKFLFNKRIANHNNSKKKDISFHKKVIITFIPLLLIKIGIGVICIIFIFICIIDWLRIDLRQNADYFWWLVRCRGLRRRRRNGGSQALVP